MAMRRGGDGTNEACLKFLLEIWFSADGLISQAVWERLNTGKLRSLERRGHPVMTRQRVLSLVRCRQKNVQPPKALWWLCLPACLRQLSLRKPTASKWMFGGCISPPDTEERRAADQAGAMWPPTKDSETAWNLPRRRLCSA
jgi:hypothetical protein